MAIADLPRHRQTDTNDPTEVHFDGLFDDGPSHRVLIVALVRLGRMEEARAATARLLEIVPESRLADIPESRLADIKPPSRIPRFAERVLSDLRLAGYPE